MDYEKDKRRTGMIEKRHLPARRVTQGPKHHFFGYFDKFPWDRSGRYLLSQETGFTARQPVPGEKAVLGVIDLQDNNKFTPVAETDAWCWQQGCMFQWLNGAEDQVIYNDREDDHFVARILDLKTGKKQTVCRPVYCLSPDGNWALSLNFSRLDRERPGYGYPGAYDKNEKVFCPDDEGVWLVDLKNNTSNLAVSIAQVTDQIDWVCFQLYKTLLTPAAEKKQEDSQETVIRNISLWLQSHYDEPVNMSELAGKNGMSHADFYVKWKKVFAITPVQYLIDLKLEAAAQRLIQTEKPISEIVREVRFSNLYAFHQRFRQKFGISPGEYRKQHSFDPVILPI